MPRKPAETTTESQTEPQTKPKKKASIDGPGVKCDVVQPNSDGERQLIYYASEPRVQTRIPRGAGEAPGAFEPVIVNGLRINILKGVSVSLPESVSKILDDAFYRTDKAINQSQVANPFTGAKMPALVEQQADQNSY